MSTTVTLDVRPIHARCEEPFDAIMAAVNGLAPMQALLLINSFEPVPLIRVLGKRGFSAHVTEIGSDEWHVLFEPR